MPNAITTQTLVDGERNVVIKINVVGDGSGEESETVLFDVSALSGAPATVKVIGIRANLTGFSIGLLWVATTDVEFWSIPAGEDTRQDFRKFGGLINNAGTGVTGDISFDTVGLGSGDEGTFILEMQKS